MGVYEKHIILKIKIKISTIIINFQEHLNNHLLILGICKHQCNEDFIFYTCYYERVIVKENASVRTRPFTYHIIIIIKGQRGRGGVNSLNMIIYFHTEKYGYVSEIEYITIHIYNYFSLLQCSYKSINKNSLMISSKCSYIFYLCP